MRTFKELEPLCEAKLKEVNAILEEVFTEVSLVPFVLNEYACRNDGDGHFRIRLVHPINWDLGEAITCLIRYRDTLKEFSCGVLTMHGGSFYDVWKVFGGDNHYKFCGVDIADHVYENLFSYTTPYELLNSDPDPAVEARNCIRRILGDLLVEHEEEIKHYWNRVEFVLSEAQVLYAEMREAEKIQDAEDLKNASWVVRYTEVIDGDEEVTTECFNSEGSATDRADEVYRNSFGWDIKVYRIVNGTEVYMGTIGPTWLGDNNAR